MHVPPFNEWQQPFVRLFFSISNQMAFFALKRFIVDLSQCRMQYAINVCMRFNFRFFLVTSRGCDSSPVPYVAAARQAKGQRQR